ncbi:MAG: MBOAT family protein [Oscillospiraceae bacterium]|nr:MBOAT family protein [Oscillospiraceae bacterium]
MVFSSMLFVFLFLTANLISQVLLKTPRAKNIAMLVFSLVFYSWSGPRYLLLLLGMVFVCWFGALQIQRTDLPEKRKPIMIVTITICLLLLGFFKYTGFLCSNLNAIFGVPKAIPNIVLPIGISFYTFQLISYVVDVYRNEVPAQRKYWMLLLYASLFHQCIAGPIVRYQDVNEDIVRRRASIGEISRGISRFTIGLAKKAILANGCAMIADSLITVSSAELAQVPAMGIALGVFAYGLQIYLDFSAYSDMAIGMGLMCGFHYKENFDYPYIADSVADFWRRWHISLTSFFRDYVYIPLGGNRCSKSRQIMNIAVVWFLTGLWHGASWNYVLWGLFFGVFIILERFVLKDFITRIPKALRHVLVILVIYFSWFLFKSTELAQAGIMLKGIFGLNHNGFTSVSVGLAFRNNIFFLILAAIAVTPFGKTLRTIMNNLSRRGGALYWINAAWEVLHPVLLLILSAMALVGNSYNPFLYFQF